MKIGIVGSGPSGVAAATAALTCGHEVEILDFGLTADSESLDLGARLRRAVEAGREPAQADLAALEATAADLPRSILDLLPFTSLSAKAPEKLKMGSNFVYDRIDQELPIDGAAPPRSLAKGGLSNIWGTACYKLREDDYGGWPVGKADMEPYYASAANILGLAGYEDQLPGTYPPAPVTRTPPHPAFGASPCWNIGSPLNSLVAKWDAGHAAMAEFGLRGGYSSLAVVPPDAANRNHCRRCGLCFYGCPVGAMFCADAVLDDLRKNPNFHYQDGVKVLSFAEQGDRVRVVLRRCDGGSNVVYFGRLILAAGALSTLRIISDSLGIHGVPAPIFDNDMFVVPMLADRSAPNGWRSNFALSEAVMAIDAGIVSERPVHIQLYAFNDYFLGGLRRFLPAGVMRSGIFNRLVIAFVYLHGDESRRAVATAELQGGADTSLKIDHQDRDGRLIMARVLKFLQQHRGKTGLRPIRSMLKSTPFGFSGHLAGTIPMRDTMASGDMSADPNGRLVGTDRIYLADASLIPKLPAQNPTYTIMANAMRIATNL